MKYTRFEFRGQRSTGLRHIIRYIVLIPVIGVMFGFIIYRLLILPNIYVADNSKADEELFYQPVMQRSFYFVQGGVFSNIKNAESAANTIQTAKIPAFIYQDEKYYRLILYSGGDYEIIKEKTSSYKSMGLDYIVKEVYANTKDVPENYKSNIKYILLSKIINETGTAVDDMFKETAKYEAKMIDYTVLSSNIRAICKKIDDSIILFNSIKEENNKFLDELRIECEHIRSIIDGISADEGNLSRIEEKKFLCIQRYKSLVELFNNNIN